MGRRNHTERGFSIIELVIILGVIAVLGGVGYIFYQQMHKPTASSQSPQSSQASQAPQTTVSVKEWGVAFTLTNPIMTEAYYTAPAIDEASGLDSIGLGTKATNGELVCSDGSKTQQTTIDKLYRSTDKDKVVTGASSDAREVGDYYYSIAYTVGAGCDSESTNAPSASEASQKFIQNFEAGNLVLE